MGSHQIIDFNGARGDGSPVARRLVALLFLYAASIPFTFRFSGVTVSPADLWLLLLLLVGGNQIVIRRRAWGPWLPLLAIAFGIGAAVTLLTGTFTPYAMVNKLIGFLSLLLLFAAITSLIRTRSDLGRLLEFYVTSTTVAAAAALALYVTPARSVVAFGDRLKGFQIDPNAFGGVIAVALVLLVAVPSLLTLGVARTRWNVLVFGGGLVILVSGLVLTNSRSAWIAAIGGLAVLAVVNPTRNLLGVVVATSVVAYGVYALVPSSATSDFILAAGRTNQIVSRFGFITEGLRAVENAPLTGIGLGQFYVAAGAIVHNSFIWLLTEMGFLGGLAFAGTVLWFFVRGVGLARSGSRNACAGLAVALVAAHGAMTLLSLGIEALYQRQWWVVMAGIGALILITCEPSDARSRESEAPSRQ